MTALSRANRSPISTWWWTVDRISLASVAVLALAGLLMVMAAGPAAAERKSIGDEFYFVIRQALFVGPALAVVFGASLLSPVGVRRLGAAVFAAALALMALTLAIGPEINGARRWISLGPVALQASEFAKPAFVVVAAWMFAEQKRAKDFPGAAIAFGLYLMLAALLVAQPDFGQTVLVTAAWGAVFFLAGLPWFWIIGLGAGVAAAGFAAYAHAPHVASRIDRFLDPSSGDTYQTDIALSALQRGGLFGRGPGEGQVKHLLPDAHTDYIFAVVGEEFGMIAGALLIVLFGLIVLRAYARALSERSAFTQYAACGLATLIGMQAFINIGVSLRLLPAKGMTLPFVSYGGSSLVATALTLGLLLALTRKRAQGSRRRDFL